MSEVYKRGNEGFFVFDCYFSSKKSEEAEMEVVANLIGMFKTNTKGFCNNTNDNITKDWPGGSYFVLRRNPVVPRGRPLISTGYKYNARKVIYFIITDNAGITHSGLPYLFKYDEQFDNVSIRPFACPLSMYKFFLQLMMLTPTINQGSLIWRWIFSGLLRVVRFVYVRQFLWEWLLLIVGNCLIMGLRDTTITNLLASDNYWNNLLNIFQQSFFT